MQSYRKLACKKLNCTATIFQKYFEQIIEINEGYAISVLILCLLQEIRSEELHNEVCQVLHGYKQVCFLIV